MGENVAGKCPNGHELTEQELEYPECPACGATLKKEGS